MADNSKPNVADSEPISSLYPHSLEDAVRGLLGVPWPPPDDQQTEPEQGDGASEVALAALALALGADSVGAFTKAETALLAMRRVETLRRHEGKKIQERRVSQQLIRTGYKKVDTRRIRTLRDAPKAATFLVDAPVFDHYAGIDTTTLLLERSGLFAAYLRPKYVYSNHLLQSAGLSPPSHRVLPQRGKCHDPVHSYSHPVTQSPRTAALVACDSIVIPGKCHDPVHSHSHPVTNELGRDVQTAS